MAKELEFKIKVVQDGNVIEKTAKSMKELEESVASLGAELKNAPIGSEKFKELQAGLKENEKALDTAKTKTGSLMDTLSEIKGPMGGVAQGFMGMGKAALSFIANPIGAVIAALGVIFMAVSKAIKNSEEAMDGITKITAIFGGIVRPIFEFIEKVAVVAINALAEGLEWVASLFGSAGEEAGNYADALDAAQDVEKDLAVTRAQTNKQLAEAKEILSDSNATYEERVKALKKVQAVENAQSQQEVDNKRELLRLAEEDIKLNGRSEEAVQKLRDAKVALANTEQDAAAKQRQFNKQQAALDREQEAKAKEAAAAEEERQKEAAARAKQYAEERRAASDKLRSEDQKNILASIADEEMRSRKAAEFAIQNSKMEIDRGKYTAAEKKKLKLEADETYALQIAAIDKKVADDKKKLDQETADLTLSLRTQLIQDAELKAEAELKIAYDKQRLDIENSKRTAEEKAALLLLVDEKYKLDQAAIDDKFIAEKLAKDMAKNQLDIDNDKLTLAERLAALEENNTLVKESTTLTEEERTRIFAENTQKRLDLIEQQRLADLKALDDGLNMAKQGASALQGIGDAVYANKLANVEKGSKEEEAIMRKQFNFNKAMQIGGAIIDGAKAAVASLAQSPIAIGPIPNPAGIASLALVAITTAASVAKIAATKFEGGGGGGGGAGAAPTPQPSKFASGGVVSGPGSGTSDSIPALISNGEAIINARSTSMYGGLLSAINVAGGGRRFATGGVAGGSEPSMDFPTPIIKTYVVASDMTSQQEADFKINQLARL